MALVLPTEDIERRLGALLQAYETGRLRVADEGGDSAVRTGTLLAKATAAIAKGASGTFEVMSGTKGSEAGTGEVIENVYCRLMAVAADGLAYIQPIDSGWEASPIDCPPEA